jgi:hypothetical protein
MKLILAAALPLLLPFTNFAHAEEEPAPFEFADFTWLNGGGRQKDFPLKGKVFTGQFNADVNYVYQFQGPKDHTLTGSTNSGRTSEVQLQQLGVGGDFNYENVRGRLMTQFGMYSTMTPRNDASPSRGQWDLSNAYRYISEAYAGYHIDALKGINVDAGLFMSYIGLCSYYNYDNWVYQMSYVSSNTPWFFNGVRVQAFLTDRLKTEFWLVNGWQAYGMFNRSPGIGFQALWRPTGDLSFVTNNYVGGDTLGTPGRTRYHSDNSAQVKYLDAPGAAISKAAFSLTADLGCESGGGVSCSGGAGKNPAQNFLGFMAYNRFWLKDERFAFTVGGGWINNPGRYLVLVPPINGANASANSYYFPQSAGTNFKAWDSSLTFNFMPSQFLTFALEYNHREANTPYFSGAGGVTPPNGNNGRPDLELSGWSPDLRRTENRINLAMMVRF